MRRLRQPQVLGDGRTQHEPQPVGAGIVAADQEPVESVPIVQQVEAREVVAQVGDKQRQREVVHVDTPWYGTDLSGPLCPPYSVLIRFYLCPATFGNSRHVASLAEPANCSAV